MFKEIFSLFNDVLELIYLIRATGRSGSRYCFDLRGKGGSESKTRRPEFLSSQVGNLSLHQDRSCVRKVIGYLNIRISVCWN
jgi:hypothetical protein